MKYLELTFDLDSGIELANPLGDLTIRGEKSEIKAKSVFLDTFLEGLVKGIDALAEKNEISIDTFDEPNPIIFSRIENDISISYESDSVMIPNYLEFKNELIRIIQYFLKIVDDESKLQQNKTVDYKELRNFACR